MRINIIYRRFGKIIFEIAYCKVVKIFVKPVVQYRREHWEDLGFDGRITLR
jgi:hypothetical protein